MELLKVETTLPTIEANFDVVKQQLIDGLKTYDVIITADTVKDGKTMASEINKIKKAIKDQQKKALEDIMGPVDGFKEKIQELMDLADEAREKITAQVSAYEEKTKLDIQKKVKAFLTEEIEKAELRDPFLLVDSLDLVKLTAVTKTGNLTSATINAIKGRVADKKNLQLEEDARIAQEQKEKDEEIARIREEERIKAEANIQAHVTVDQQEQNWKDVTSEQSAEVRYNNSYPKDDRNSELIFEPITEPPYQETHEEFNPDTGEVYDIPAYMNDVLDDVHPEAKSGTVIITAEFEVDISTIPNITDEQLTNAIQKRLKAADVNNSTIVAINRY
jgi:DNA-binding transcriptional MerR regulator